MPGLKVTVKAGLAPLLSVDLRGASMARRYDIAFNRELPRCFPASQKLVNVPGRCADQKCALGDTVFMSLWG
jgi:hypothetical protein